MTPSVNKPKLDLRELVALKAEADRVAARYKIPPCLECGATTLAEAYEKCGAGKGRDHCHGCDLWPYD